MPVWHLEWRYSRKFTQMTNRVHHANVHMFDFVFIYTLHTHTDSTDWNCVARRKKRSDAMCRKLYGQRKHVHRFRLSDFCGVSKLRVFKFVYLLYWNKPAIDRFIYNCVHAVYVYRIFRSIRRLFHKADGTSSSHVINSVKNSWNYAPCPSLCAIRTKSFQNYLFERPRKTHRESLPSRIQMGAFCTKPAHGRYSGRTKTKNVVCFK